MLQITANITIPDDELVWSFARSGGPGGQNVNKVNSKAILHWDVTASAALPDDVKGRFLVAYKTRLTTEGVLVLSNQEYRDQPQNIEACRERLRGMIVQVLRAPKKRRPTKPTKGSQRRRLSEKKARSDVKKGRQSRGGDE